MFLSSMSLQTIEVPILETPPSVEDFVTNYLAPGKPVIIRGALESFWPAMSKWSLNWLKEHVGGV
jgi:jumonji domain-containing protein 7